jgi:hypothetical protein
MIATLLISMATPSQLGPSTTLSAFIHRSRHVSSYKQARADLNGDRRPEILLYVTDADSCGSGGCRLVVLSPRRSTYRIVLRSTVTQLPIRLFPTFTHGWADIGVTVSGGGINERHTALLRFDGRRYPTNPTVPPATPLRKASGKVLID